LHAAAFRAFASQHPTISFLFVNDGSSDGTRELLDELSGWDGEQFKVLHLERNCGKAEATRRGMQEAFRLGPVYAGYWDADLATPLEAIPDFTEHLDAHPQVEMIFGSRVRLMGHRIVRRPLRHYLGRVFATVASATLGISIYDTQCGAKIFRTSPAIQRLFAQPYSSRWIFDVEILARFLHEFRATDRGMADDVIHEIPLLRWEDTAGSKIRPLDFVRAIRELWVIHRTWLRKGASRPGRGGSAGTAPTVDATWAAQNAESSNQLDHSLS
jgi:glycosyltransferase involved in cell wall biosynthesis